MLEKEYNFYKNKQKEFLKKYSGKVLLIVGEELIEVFDDEESAYKKAITLYKLGSFLIQRCAPENETIQTFHSRVIFP